MLDLTTAGPIKVLIATPSIGSVDEAYIESVDALRGAMNPDRVQTWRRTSMGSNICENQNTLVDIATEWGADFILFCEADMGFPETGLARLLSHQKDIVGATYQFKEHDLLADLVSGKTRVPRYMGFELDGKPITLQSLREGERLRKVAGVPMGFTLIRTRCLDRVRSIVAERTDRDGQIARQLLERPELEAVAAPSAPVFRHAISYPIGRERGVSSTTDMTFCGDARDAGLDVWLDAELSLMMIHRGIASFGVHPKEAA